MRNVGRKLAFVLAASNHGTMIVNRFDYRPGADGGQGVGHQILEAGAYDPVEVEMAIHLLELRRQFYGDGVVAIDCGANTGVHTVERWRRRSGSTTRSPATSPSTTASTPSRCTLRSRPRPA